MTVRSTAKKATRPTSLPARPPQPTRTYLPAAKRKGHLLDVGVALIRSEGWDHLSIARLASRAGVSRQLVHQYFGDLESLALALAARFDDEVYATALASIERHPDDLRAAMQQTLERFLVGLREKRLAYLDLLLGQSYHPRPGSPLRRVSDRKRQRLVEVWARYYERVNGLARADAEALSSFQYDGLRGLITQVDRGQLRAEEAIELFLQILEAAIVRFGGRLQRRRTRRASGRHRA